MTLASRGDSWVRMAAAGDGLRECGGRGLVACKRSPGVEYIAMEEGC